MSARVIRAILLIAVAALLGNARCVDDCSTTSVPSKAPSTNCPLHKPAGGHPADCERQHAQFATAASEKIQMDRQPLVGTSLNSAPAPLPQPTRYRTLLLRRNETPPRRNPVLKVTVLRV